MVFLRKILVLGFSSLLLFGVIYPLLIVTIGKLAPSYAGGLPIWEEGKLVGFENIGQPFVSRKYFHSRPSSVNYDASSTGGSNLGPTNPDFLNLVKSRIDTLLYDNPGLEVGDIPVDMVTASGSGLDPHISQKGALIQVSRIARVRELPREQLVQLVETHTEKPLWGLFGPGDRVNVLELNRALDQLSLQN